MEWKERPRPAGPSSPGAIHFPSSSNPNRNSLEPNSSRTGLDLDRSPNLSINSDRGTSGGSGGTFLNLAARRSPIPGSGKCNFYYRLRAGARSRKWGVSFIGNEIRSEWRE